MTFRNDLHLRGMEIPYSTDTDSLKKPLCIYGKELPNRLGILPLEGFDSLLDGSPSEHVYRRYLRFAAGGVEEGWFDIAGFGRQALAYPDFATDILTRGSLDTQKCCVGCFQCYKLMDPGHSRVYCVVRDK